MSVLIKTGAVIDDISVQKYFHNLVNLFFKILPMRESNESSLIVYMENLRDELLGCQELLPVIKSDPRFLSLVFTLQWMIDRPQCPVSVVRGKVFRSISICKKIEESFAER